jgi:hypothetical protein
LNIFELKIAKFPYILLFILSFNSNKLLFKLFSDLLIELPDEVSSKSIKYLLFSIDS